MNIKFDLALYLFDCIFWWFWVLRFFVKTSVSVLNYLFNQDFDMIEYRESPKRIKKYKKKKVRTGGKCVLDLTEPEAYNDSSEHLTSNSDEIIFSSSHDN